MRATKDEFHKLIDQIQDEVMLKGYFELIQRLNRYETGNLWNSLTEVEKNELLISYEESFSYSNIISHEQIKEQHVKWLKR